MWDYLRLGVIPNMMRIFHIRIHQPPARRWERKISANSVNEAAKKGVCQWRWETYRKQPYPESVGVNTQTVFRRQPDGKDLW
jgi:hypothetical protein